jgi:hypothetical protein
MSLLRFYQINFILGVFKTKHKSIHLFVVLFLYSLRLGGPMGVRWGGGGGSQRVLPFFYWLP